MDVWVASKKYMSSPTPIGVANLWLTCQHRNHISLCLHAKSRIMPTHAKARHEQPDEVSMHV